MSAPSDVVAPVGESKKELTFREKYIDQEYNWEFWSSIALEFVATIVFILGIMQIPYIGLGPVVSGLIVFFLAAVTIYAFAPRCGAPFNPCITLGLMCGGKINLIKGIIISKAT